MKIVAFMMNPWFRTGTPSDWIIRYRDDQEFHREILGRSMSGKALQLAFEELYDEIWWDNINWRCNPEPDFGHIDRVIETVEPKLILCFGKPVFDAVTKIDPPIPFWGCHNPNAKHKTQEDLNQFAQMVRDFKHAKNTCDIRTTGNG